MRWFALVRFLMLLLLTIPLAAKGQTGTGVKELRDQSQITITGTLRIEQRGWRTCFFIATPHSYRVMFDPAESSPRNLNLIQINLRGQDDSLRRNVGRPITATGRIQLEAVSPYYCNGALMVADEVTLPNGLKLRQNVTAEIVPASIDRYKASISITPGADWKFDARTSSGSSLGTTNLAGCGLNGSGEIMNCYCSEGFRPVAGHSTSQGRQSEGDNQGGFLQFELDEEAKHPVTINVECVRSKPKD
jgi:hypothetical protein